jgi:hypothetical protein
MNWKFATRVTALIFGTSAALGQSTSSTNLLLSRPTPAISSDAAQLKTGVRTTNKWPLLALSALQARRSPAPLQLKPGIYETAPYTCIVIVPDPHVDERAIIGSGPSNAPDLLKMPTNRPDLQYIPRVPGK